MPDITKLSETRKADRTKIAQLVSDVCSEFKIDHKWTREGFDEAYPKAHVIEIMAPRGVRCRIELDGDSCQPNVHVLPWNVAIDSDARFSARFGSVNQAHHQKMTAVAYNTDGLLAHLRSCFRLINSGAAFDEEREKEAIAKYGSAAERMAKWKEYLAEWLEQQAKAKEEAHAD